MPLNIRFSKHKNKSKLHPNIKLYKHFAKIGIEHFKIILIKNYPCNNKLELEIEEERIKTLLNAQLITYRAHITAEQKKAKDKIYRENNRAKIRLHKNESLFCKICGKSYTRQNKSRHNKSKRHQKCVHLNQSKKITDEKYQQILNI